MKVLRNKTYAELARAQADYDELQQSFIQLYEDHEKLTMEKNDLQELFNTLEEDYGNLLIKDEELEYQLEKARKDNEELQEENAGIDDLVNDNKRLASLNKKQGKMLGKIYFLAIATRLAKVGTPHQVMGDKLFEVLEVSSDDYNA